MGLNKSQQLNIQNKPLNPNIMSTTDQEKPKEESKKLNLNSYENLTLPTGVTIHTIILLYNSMFETDATDQSKEILKFQLAESLLPGDKKFHGESAEVILSGTLKFLKTFFQETIDKGGD